MASRRIAAAAAAFGLVLLGAGVYAQAAPSDPCDAVYTSSDVGHAYDVCRLDRIEAKIDALSPTTAPSSQSPSATPTPVPVTPTPTPAPSTSTPPPVSPVGGFSRLVFADDFSGTTLDRVKWAPCWYYPTCGKMNGSSTPVKNVSVSGGQLHLLQLSAAEGALVTTNKSAGASTGFRLVGNGYAEARVLFPGDGSRCLNWPAWWTNGPESGYTDGEIDVAEVGGTGTMGSNYHYGNPDRPNNASVAGSWCGSWHTYGVWRQANLNVIYFDGKEVRRYTTSDNGASHELVLNTGFSSGKTLGVGKTLDVDYVKVWQN